MFLRLVPGFVFDYVFDHQTTLKAIPGGPLLLVRVNDGNRRRKRMTRSTWMGRRFGRDMARNVGRIEWRARWTTYSRWRFRGRGGLGSHLLCREVGSRLRVLKVWRLEVSDSLRSCSLLRPVYSLKYSFTRLTWQEYSF